ncbi:MAG: SDR family oxidoreductase [Leptospirales bacterium]
MTISTGTHCQCVFHVGVRKGFNVNAVAPGSIASHRTADVSSPGLISRLVPIQRAGTPAEVAFPVVFSTSPQSSSISGRIISVNGT